VIDIREMKHLGTSRGDDWFTPHGSFFLNWIDDDLAGAAESSQSRAGDGKIETIDLESDSGWSRIPRIWAWQYGGAK
jgi:hypothetical protein